VRAAARNLAERERGFRAISSPDAVTTPAGFSKVEGAAICAGR
jgi:hypothetical protein